MIKMHVYAYMYISVIDVMYNYTVSEFKLIMNALILFSYVA